MLVVNLPEIYIDELEKLIQLGRFPSRSEAIRVAIRNLIVSRINLRKQSNESEEKIADNNNIFKNSDTLHTSFVSDSNLYHNSEISAFLKNFQDSLNKNTNPQFMIVGAAGSGKTHLLSAIIHKNFEDSDNPTQKNTFWVYVNCEQTDSDSRFLLNIYNQLLLTGIKKGIKLHSFQEIPFTGLPLDEIMQQIIDLMNFLRKDFFFLCLDGVDSLFNRGGGKEFNLISEIGRRLNHGKIVTINTSRDSNLIKVLERKSLKIPSENILFLKELNVEQLKLIINERLRTAFQPEIYSDEIIELCSELTANQHGDLKFALSLLKRIGEIAIQQNAQKISVTHVWKAYQEIVTNDFEGVIISLNLQEKLMLLSLFLLKKQGINQVRMGNFCRFYRFVTGQIKNISILSERRVFSIISKLTSLGLIEKTTVSTGRTGRTSIISLKFDARFIERFLLKNISIKDSYGSIQDMVNTFDFNSFLNPDTQQKPRTITDENSASTNSEHSK